MKRPYRFGGLTKRFGTTQALDNLSLDVEKGDVFGFLGPNGAGKTTTMRILATLLRQDGGTAEVMGRNVVREARAGGAAVDRVYARLEWCLSRYVCL